jgi:two-component system chemotaxis response regulator CheB
MTGVIVIVVGGSAGALDALLSIVPALPATFRLPIVVVLHMSGDHPNLIPAILERASQLPVVEIEDKQPLVAGTIFVAPPSYHVLFERDHTLALSADDAVNFSRPSIDVAFESAADAYGAGVVAIMLSGANDDGARGLQRIRAAGGGVWIQDPATAELRTMPEAAIAVNEGVVVQPPAELARALIALDREEVRP